MKLSKTTLVIPLAAALLVGAAGAVMATTATPAAPEVQALAAATPTPSPSPGTTVKPAVKDDLLTGVLDDLVTKGTINSGQKTAILNALAAERTARQEARKAARDKAKADLQQIKGFLSDGVITKEEFDKLPADSALRKVTTLMDDDKITTDELKSIWRGLGIGKDNGNVFGGKGHGFFGGGKGNGNGNGAAPSASPAPTS